MKGHILKIFFLLGFSVSPLEAKDPTEVSLRFHAQWDLAERDHQKVLETYGPYRVHFEQGHAIPYGLLPEQRPRWKRLYELCMCDGCYYCDASEGSCEIGTCGLNNSSCKPHMEREGVPRCGLQCADYAFMSVLP